MKMRDDYTCPLELVHDIIMLTGNNLFPQFNICEYIATYRNEFFYYFFGYRELKLFEREPEVACMMTE